jgi:hypothetical protein
MNEKRFTEAETRAGFNTPALVGVDGAEGIGGVRT